MIKDSKLRKKLHIRKKVVGTKDRPRLSVYKSLKAFYVQAIDDDEGKTLVSVSCKRSGTEAAMEAFATIVSDKLANKKVTKICFDRNGNKFHGAIKLFADALRRRGIDF